MLPPHLWREGRRLWGLRRVGGPSSVPGRVPSLPWRLTELLVFYFRNPPSGPLFGMDCNPPGTVQDLKTAQVKDAGSGLGTFSNRLGPTGRCRAPVNPGPVPANPTNLALRLRSAPRSKACHSVQPLGPTCPPNPTSCTFLGPWSGEQTALVGPGGRRAATEGSRALLCPHLQTRIPPRACKR